jgi:aspartate kinase
MIIHKFGGAAVKDSHGIKNLYSIVKERKEEKIIVISALGKTTNNLERLTDTIYYKREAEFNSQLQRIKNYHLSIIENLFPKGNPIFEEVEIVFQNLNKIALVAHQDYDFLYDQVVSLGEILSTKIVSAYLNLMHVKCNWIDIRKHLITDNVFREANINWEMTRTSIKENFPLNDDSLILTQGFIGGTDEGHSTTLGREGSDYSAAIIANILDAESVIVWKDVPGILNADPRYFKTTEKLEAISYQEAIELAFYGAKIIHPKTIKPLQNKSISLYVKSFMDSTSSGTIISESSRYTGGKPVYIVKNNQILISVVPKDFSFVFEERLSKIYELFAMYRIKVNLIQNSAINFSVAADENNPRIEQLIEQLKLEFKVLYNSGLVLYTIRHYNAEAIRKIAQGRKVLVEQRSRHTAQFLMEEDL